MAVQSETTVQPTHPLGEKRRPYWGQILRNPQIPIVVVCLICFVAPAIMVVTGAFRTTPFGGGEWSAEMFWSVLQSPSMHSALWTTVSMGLVTVIISTVLAITFAAITTRTNTPLRGLLPLIMALVVATPSLFYAISWAMLGNERAGIINVFIQSITGLGEGPINVESWWGIVLVTVLRIVGLQYFLLLGPFMAMDRSLEESARVSGAGPIRAFFTIEIPVLWPAITGVAILSYIIFLESFDIPQVLGVPARIFVLPTELYSYLSAQTGPEYGRASTIGILLMIATLVLVILQLRFLGNRAFTTVGGRESRSQVRNVGMWRWVFAALIVLFAIFAVILPLTQLVLGSLSPFYGSTGTYTLDNYQRIFSDARVMQAFGVSAVVALGGGALAMIAAVGFAWAARLRRGVMSRFIEITQWLGLAMPGLILGLGVLWFFLSVPGMHRLYGTMYILLFGLFVAVIPVASRAATGAVAQIPLSLEEAAWVAGSSRIRALISIVGRLILPSFLSGWLLCIVIISGTLALPLVLASPGTPFISVIVYEYYAAGQAHLAAAVFVVLIAGLLALTAATMLLRWWLTRAARRGSRSTDTLGSADDARGPAVPVAAGVATAGPEVATVGGQPAKP